MDPLFNLLFNEELAQTFRLFSKSHLYALLIIFFLAMLIVFFRKYFRNRRVDRLMRGILISITLGQELVLNIYRYYNGQLTLAYVLPLHLCSLGIILSSLILWSKSRALFRHTFLIILIGATLAMLTPSIERGFGYPHFRYYQFFVSHGMIVLNMIYILVVFQFYKGIIYKDLWRNYFVLLLIAFIVYFINLLVDGNYMYLMRKPDGETAFDYLGPYPWYLLNIGTILAPLLLHLLYTPLLLKRD